MGFTTGQYLCNYSTLIGVESDDWNVATSGEKGCCESMLDVSPSAGIQREGR